MAYASIEYASVSGTTFALTNSDGNNIPYIKASDITVKVNDVVIPYGAGGSNEILQQMTQAMVASEQITKK